MNAANIVTVAVALIAAAASTIAALLGRHNKRELSEIRINVDGRLTALIDALDAKGILAAQVANLEGHAQGVSDERAAGQITSRVKED